MGSLGAVRVQRCFGEDPLVDMTSQPPDSYAVVHAEGLKARAALTRNLICVQRTEQIFEGISHGDEVRCQVSVS